VVRSRSFEEDSRLFFGPPAGAVSPAWWHRHSLSTRLMPRSFTVILRLCISPRSLPFAMAWVLHYYYLHTIGKFIVVCKQPTSHIHPLTPSMMMHAPTPHYTQVHHMAQFMSDPMPCTSALHAVAAAAAAWPLPWTVPRRPWHSVC
jgi:hypothetical protein